MLAAYGRCTDVTWFLIECRTAVLHSKVSPVGIQRVAAVWRRSGVNTGQSPPHGKTALTASGGRNMGGWPQDIQETGHSGYHHCTAAGAREPNIYQKKFQRCAGENRPGAQRRKLYFAGRGAPAETADCLQQVIWGARDHL